MNDANTFRPGETAIYAMYDCRLCGEKAGPPLDCIVLSELHFAPNLWIECCHGFSGGQFGWDIRDEEGDYCFAIIGELRKKNPPSEILATVRARTTEIA